MYLSVTVHLSFTRRLLLLHSSQTSHVPTFSNQANLFLPPSASQERKEKNQRQMASDSSNDGEEMGSCRCHLKRRRMNENGDGELETLLHRT
ncbi:unnamed protein product [Linum trigynum]|uniref:Uncharacterized protein n=1 Tax=Linum trigynum TaxID=586398 RepID=A0AAV2EME2_9ROSI